MRFKELYLLTKEKKKLNIWIKLINLINKPFFKLEKLLVNSNE
jgi:hypothetical protein